MGVAYLGSCVDTWHFHVQYGLIPHRVDMDQIVISIVFKGFMCREFSQLLREVPSLFEWYFAYQLLCDMWHFHVKDGLIP